MRWKPIMAIVSIIAICALGFTQIGKADDPQVNPKAPPPPKAKPDAKPGKIAPKPPKTITEQQVFTLKISEKEDNSGKLNEMLEEGWKITQIIPPVAVGKGHVFVVVVSRTLFLQPPQRNRLEIVDRSRGGKQRPKR